MSTPELSRANGAPAPAEADALREEIARTRSELAETVQALAAKADVKARVRERVDVAVSRAEDIRRDLPGQARLLAVRMGRELRDRPAPYVTAIGALLVLMALLRWRRNR